MFFHMRLFHEQWFAEQQPYVQQVEMVQPSQPHLAVVESTINGQMPTPAADMPATIDVDTTATAMEASRGRLFNNLMAIAKRIITVAVEAGPEKCKQVEAGLHALAASVTAPPSLQYANPPPRARRSASAKPAPQAKKAKEGTCREAGVSNRGPYSSDTLSWTCCEHNFHSVAHSSRQCGTFLPRHVAVALGTVDSSNVGFHPYGNAEQHVIGFATRNAVAVIYATTVVADCYALGTHYFAPGVAEANAATPFGAIPCTSSAIQFACVHLHTNCFLVY